MILSNKTIKLMVLDLKANEVVVKASDSNHLNKNSEKVNGKFIVTNQRIYFKSSQNEQNSFDRAIEPSEIKEVIYFSTYKVFANGLNIVTKSGEELKFTVKKRNDFGTLINKMN